MPPSVIALNKIELSVLVKCKLLVLRMMKLKHFSFGVKYQSLTVIKYYKLCKVITYMPCIFMFLKVYSDSFCFKLFLPDKLKSYQTSYLYLGQEFHYMSCRMITNLLRNGKDR